MKSVRARISLFIVFVILFTALSFIATSTPSASAAPVLKRTWTAGETDSLIVPTGITSIRFVVVGGHGADGEDAGSGNGGTGGAPAIIDATYTVTPGETLDITVGSNASGATGGSNGGGDGGACSSPYYYGGGAGGKSTLYRSATPLAIAGGGGGGGGATSYNGGMNAGHGGNSATVGSNGTKGPMNFAGGNLGTGATQSAAGIGGNGGNTSRLPSQAGQTFAEGGAGGDGPTNPQMSGSGCGGGGGAGYYGGGAGGSGGSTFNTLPATGGGGGGGSSFVSGASSQSITSTTTTSEVIYAYWEGDTCTWDTDGGNMSDASNWICLQGSVPGQGDHLIIDGTGRSENVAVLTNDLDPNPRFSSVSITGNVVINDAVLNVSGDTTATGGILNLEIGLDITASSNVDLTISDQDGGMLLHDVTVDMGTNDLSLIEDEDAYLFELNSLDGTLGTLTIDGAQTGFIGNTASTFTTSENISIVGGTIDCQQAACLGNDANDVIISGNGQFMSRVSATYANDINLNSGLLRSLDSSPTFSGAIESLGIDDQLYTSGDNSILTISGTLNLNESTLTVNAENYQSNAKVVTTGNITGLGDFNVGSSGIYELTGGTSSFVGTFSVLSELDPDFPTNGRAYIAALAGFSPDATYIVNENVSLQTLATGTITSDFELNGQGQDIEGYDGALSWTRQATGNLTISGDIEVTGDWVKILNASNGRTLSLTGIISGDGDLNVYNILESNTTSIGGLSSENTFTGTLLQNGGRVNLGKPGAAPHDVIVEGSDADLRGFLAVGALPGTSAIGGTLDITAGDAEIINNVTLTGLISESADSTLSLGFTTTMTLDIEGTNTFNGAFFGGGDLEGELNIDKTGPGTFISTGASDTTFDFSVAFNVREGTATFTNEINNQLNVFVQGGTLNGDGILGSLTQDEGHVAPGLSPGCLTSAGDVDFGTAAFASLDIELGGTTACTGYDQIVSDTDVDLNSTTLNINLYGGFSPSEGDVFTIVRAPNVQGVFDGLESGKSYTNSGHVFRIDYNTGLSGEDSVTLTVSSSTPTSGVIQSLPDTGTDTHSTINFALLLMCLGAIVIVVMKKRSRIRAM